VSYSRRLVVLPRGPVGQDAGWLRSAKMRRCRLSCPLPLRERAQWCAHDFEWVRGLFRTGTPHPSSRVAAPSCPLPQGERATIAATALVGPAALVVVSHDVKQPISFPRRISAPGVCIVASLTPNRGVGGAPRNVR